MTSGQKLVIFQRSTTPSWIYSSKWTPSRHLLFQSQQWKHKNNMYSFSNLTINIKERRQKASMASLWGLYFQLWTDSINSKGVSIVGFEQVNNGCDYPFFFCLGFLSQDIHNSQESRANERPFLISLYHFYPLKKHLHISREISAESSSLHLASGLTRTLDSDCKSLNTKLRAHFPHRYIQYFDIL